MKLLTFIGVNDYDETLYRWENHTYSSRFVAEAIAEWLNSECIVVFLTSKASQHPNWQLFQEKMSHRNLIAAPIPDGNTEEELWNIFNEVVNRVNEGEHVALDITHAFRSLPMLLLVVGSFLQATRQVQIEHIFYGQYVKGQCETPVLDLVLLLHLIDWTSAVRRFKETGDARWIGETLVQTHNQLYKTGTGKPRSLQKAGKELANLAQSLRLGRLLEIAKTSAQLQSILPQAAGEIRTWAKPFELLLDDLQKQTQQIAYTDTATLNTEHLFKQLDIIRQLFAYGLIMQAAQAAREWVVNWAIWYSRRCVALPEKQWLDKKVRKQIEHDLNNAFRPEKTTPPPPEWLDNQNLAELLRSLWPALSDPRNDLAHCGMRLDPRSTRNLVQQTEKYLHMLDDVMQLSSSD